jgi:uncharacterized protein with WD repeat
MIRRTIQTPELYLRFNSRDDALALAADAEWEKAIASYNAHLESLRGKMPTQVINLSKMCLHDADVLLRQEQQEPFELAHHKSWPWVPWFGVTLKGHSGPVWGVEFSPDGTQLASVSADQSIKVWATSSGQLLRTLKGISKVSCNVVFSPQGKQLASVGEDAAIQVWDIATGKVVERLEGHERPPRHLVFSGDGRRLASCGDDQTIKVWDVGSGQALYTIKGGTGRIWGLAFNRSGTRLVSSGADQTVRLWDAANGQLVLTLRGHSHEVGFVRFSPDGSSLASADWDGTLKIWDARPLSEEVRVEREALGLLEYLFAKPLAKQEVIARVRDDGTISDAVRRQALALVQRYQ